MTPRKPSKSSPLTENSDSSRTPRPNPRSSEIGDPMRRSFSGNPFQKLSIVANPMEFNPVTPANSPSDWVVRGRESNTMRFLREAEEKENGRGSNNQKRPAANSPSITNSKGVKNFMSPTISAASKINASPNKKILTERNSHDQPPLRSSVASLDLRSSCSSISNLSETLKESETRFGKELDLKGSVFNPTVGAADSLLQSNDIVEGMKPSFPSALEPIDADPLSLMSPYDPKTNFLAPRPKFLYYKPKEMDCNPLDSDDGLFSDSDCFSESESTEETESDSSKNESADNVSLQIPVAKEEEELVAADTDPKLHQSPGIEKEAVTERERSRKHLFTRSNCIVSAFILLLVACSAIMELNHPQIARCYNSMIKESNFPIALEVASKKTKHLRTTFEENLKRCYDFSVSYAGALMSELGGEHRLGHVTFFNLTNLEETQWNDKKMENLIQDADSDISKILEQNVQIEAEEKEESDLDSRIEAEVEVDVVDESPDDEISSIEFELDEDENSSCTDEELKLVEMEEEAVQPGIAEEEEVIAAAVEEGKMLLEEPGLFTIQSGEVEDEQKVICSVEKENILEEVKESEVVVAAAEKESDLPQVEELVPTDIKIVSQDSAEAEVVESIESSSSSRLVGEGNFLGMTQIAALSSSLILALVAGCVAFKKIRSSMVVVSSNAAQEEEHILGAAKKFNISPVSGNNTLMAEFDFVGDSSEKGLKKRSGDPLMNPGKSSSRRRETVAASSSSDDMSMGGSASPSLSYGSFTTYEMIPIKKKRNGDEDLVITPLRRSSRLRK